MINLIVADDHVILREALCELLSTKGAYNIVGQASDGEELISLMGSCTADLVILDVSMPKVDGLGALALMQTNGNAYPPVLVLSANEAGPKVRAALKAGAKGYLSKNAGLEELEFAISSIIEGKTYLSPTVTGPLMGGNDANEAGGKCPFDKLTTREREIVKHLADGMPNREIGKLLIISTRTVDTHRSNIMKKMKVKTNAELVRLAIAHGFVAV